MKNQIERAEPSRGEPQAHDHECGFSGEHEICRCVTCGHTWRRNDLTYSFVDLPLTENEKLRAGHVVLLEALRMAHRYFLQSNKLTVDDREMLDEMWAAIKQAERT